MSMPRYPGKFCSSPFFNPEDFIGYIRDLGLLPPDPAPRGVILSYQSSLSRYVVETCSTRPAGAYFKDKLRFIEDPWAGSGSLALVSGFGVGAPAAAVMLEELIAWGVREFISMGTAGSLRADLPPGSLALCTGAFKDEGTSRHYIEGDDLAHPDPGLTARLESALRENGLSFASGPTWTTDAIYRETPHEVLGYRKEGALVVEMEAAALFSVAAYRDKPIAACFSISDTLAELAWRPEFHADTTKEGLQKLFHAAVKALL